MQKLVLIAAIALLSGAANAAENSDTPCESIESIGVAQMSEDGVIFMHLRSPGSIIESDLRYEPGMPEYESIKQHLGGMAPGEWKSVRPWCKD